jgi:phenylpropionate dioxygenase-like ring-hydroxylating dioxygenase large terminal subunit
MSSVLSQLERGVVPALPGRDYHDPDIFEQERQRIFHRKWFCVGRAEQARERGDFFVVEVIDEGVLVVRGDDSVLRAFYNVCRHRGSELCEGSGRFKSVIKCPYHSWCYALDGRLVGTPNVGSDEGLDRRLYALHPVALETWDGFVFVSLAAGPGSLLASLREEVDEPLSYGRYQLAELTVGHRIVYDVRANWKIIIDNFNECLHCPGVHPELARIVPLYRRGMVIDEGDSGTGVRLADGARTFSFDGTSGLPVFPGLSDEDIGTYYGFAAFPNLLVNLLSDTVMSYLLLPAAPDRTQVVSEYLFRPETVAADDFDPSPVVSFLDLVSRQDWAVCERAQRGIRSRAFDRGMLPWNDRLLHVFAQRYLRERDGT